MLLYEMIARKIPYQGMSPGVQAAACSRPVFLFSTSTCTGHSALRNCNNTAVAAAVAVVSQRVLPPLPSSVPDWVRACCRYEHSR